jgi:hypothetical protein
VEAFERRNVTVLIVVDNDLTVAAIEGCVGWIELDADSLQRNGLGEGEDNRRPVVVIAAGFVGSRDILVTHPVGVHVLKLTSWRVDLVRAPNKVDAVLWSVDIRWGDWVSDIVNWLARLSVIVPEVVVATIGVIIWLARLSGIVPVVVVATIGVIGIGVHDRDSSRDRKCVNDVMVQLVHDVDRN